MALSLEAATMGSMSPTEGIKTMISIIRQLDRSKVIANSWERKFYYLWLFPALESEWHHFNLHIPGAGAGKKFALEAADPNVILDTKCGLQSPARSYPSVQRQE